MTVGEQETTLEFTPTWVVAVVCAVLVSLSFAVERLFHYVGKFLEKKNRKPLNKALQKLKLELMLLGVFSLLLVASQNSIAKICVPRGLTLHMLPCSLKDREHVESKTPTSHSQTFSSFSATSGTARRLLAEEKLEYCARKNKVPLLSTTALNHLDTFIFVLAMTHLIFSVLTIVFGEAKIRQWKRWEDSIAKENYDTRRVLEPTRVIHVRQHPFIRDHLIGFGNGASLLGWIRSFFKQFYGSVTKSDYVSLRIGFIMTHCRGNPKFNFYKYMIHAFEDDFKKVVGISWYLWIFVVIFLLLNINGWNTYFWIAFIPFILLLAVGTKLEHVIIQLAHDVAEKHCAVEGELVVQPSDDHFWFHRPHIVLFLIHFILFQNAFEIAFFFWIWVTYGFNSCIMGRVRYVVPRLIVGVFIQVLCSYSTLPLYAIITQMGSHFKKAIFDDHVQVGLVGWARKAKKRRRADLYPGQGHSQSGAVAGIQLGSVFQRAAAPQDNAPAPRADGSN